MGLIFPFFFLDAELFKKNKSFREMFKLVQFAVRMYSIYFVHATGMFNW